MHACLKRGGEVRTTRTPIPSTFYAYGAHRTYTASVLVLWRLRRLHFLLRNSLRCLRSFLRSLRAVLACVLRCITGVKILRKGLALLRCVGYFMLQILVVQSFSVFFITPKGSADYDRQKAKYHKS